MTIEEFDPAFNSASRRWWLRHLSGGWPVPNEGYERQLLADFKAGRLDDDPELCAALAKRVDRMIEPLPDAEQERFAQRLRKLLLAVDAANHAAEIELARIKRALDIYEGKV